jgi:hypothetical protein
VSDLQEQLRDNDEQWDKMIADAGINQTDRLLLEAHRRMNANHIVVCDALERTAELLHEVLREVRQERARTLFGDPEKP